jgi:XTP/dITP diphosphohydrolase
VVASHNADKIREVEQVLQALADPPGIVRGLSWPAIDETEPTLAGNALLKARTVAAFTGEVALADDTGLEVDALGGAPGVRTARFAGADATYADNVAKLLAEMRDHEQRGARFRTAVALVEPDGDEVVVEGVLEGSIAREARGSGGFGYDPVFELDDGRTLAELPEAEKNVISHRARALHALVDVLAGDESAISYRPAGEAEAVPVRELLLANGWAERAANVEMVVGYIRGATRTVTAWHGSRLVGFARAITDDVANGYLSMVVVDEAYRRRGIGTRLVRMLMGDDERITWVLRAGSGEPFWKALGFAPSTIAYERVRTSPRRPPRR